MSKCILETDYKDTVLKVSHLLAGRQKPPNKIGKEGGFLGGSVVKNAPANQRRREGFSRWVGAISWRRKCQPTLVFLPGESHGKRSLPGYSP